MRKDKRGRVERAGWKVGDAKDFLGLTDADMAVIDLRVSLAAELRRRRRARNLSQAARRSALARVNPASRKWKQAIPRSRSIY